jgi:hypothetical protein
MEQGSIQRRTHLANLILLEGKGVLKNKVFEV